MAKQIKTKITCENLAPLLKFDEEIESDTLKIAIFANNGSGKTFLSRIVGVPIIRQLKSRVIYLILNCQV